MDVNAPDFSNVDGNGVVFLFGLFATDELFNQVFGRVLQGEKKVRAQSELRRKKKAPCLSVALTCRDRPFQDTRPYYKNEDNSSKLTNLT